MIAMAPRPLLDPISSVRYSRRPLIAWSPRLLVVPTVALGLLAALALHQPSDRASAYSAGDGTMYSAQVVTPTNPPPASPVMVLGQRDAAPLVVQLPAARPAGHAALRLPVPANGDTLRGGPTISPARINAVLSAYGSPMAGQGQGLYDLGVKYGIDPAYCLAFFVHESGAGTQGEAVLTHNLGNIRAIAGLPSMGGYRYFDTWLEGAEAWYQLIDGLYIKQWKLATVDQIIPVYAPSADSNDPAAYIDGVKQLVAGWRAQAGATSQGRSGL